MPSLVGKVVVKRRMDILDARSVVRLLLFRQTIQRFNCKYKPYLYKLVFPLLSPTGLKRESSTLRGRSIAIAPTGGAPQCHARACHVFATVALFNALVVIA